MRVFRLARKKYAQPLSGLGSAKYAHRWNSRGTEIVYCAESRALALAEILVNVGLATLPDDYVMVGIDIPERIKIAEVSTAQLPENWNCFPHLPATRKIGDRFAHANAFCVIKVPSAVVQGDFNFLINPNHIEFRNINIAVIEDFKLDNRLFST